MGIIVDRHTTYLRDSFLLREGIQTVFQGYRPSNASLLGASSHGTVVLYRNARNHSPGRKARRCHQWVDLAIDTLAEPRSSDIHSKVPVHGDTISAHYDRWVIIIWDQATNTALKPRAQRTTASISRRYSQPESVARDWTSRHFFHVCRGLLQSLSTLRTTALSL